MRKSRAAFGDAHQEIGVVSRDRGGGYGEAASKALPHAVQVADRWHLMENASAARKLAILLHCIWSDGTEFNWGKPR
jgi:hypothetical protein